MSKFVSRIRRISPGSLLWATAHTILILLGFLFFGGVASGYIGDAISVGIGGSLVATGISGLVLYLYVVRTENVKNQLNIINEAGIIQVFPGRSARIREEYEQRIANAKEIDILGFGLSSLREDHLRNFEGWSFRSRIRIVLLDPDFPISNSYSQQRDKEEGNPPGKIRNDIQQFLESVQKLESLNHNNFQIRLMTAIPSVNIFRVDDELFWGPYLLKEQSRNTPTLLVRRGGYLFRSLTDHFETLWNNSDYSRPVWPA